MFYFELEKIMDINLLKQIYSSIYDFKLFNLVFINFKLDIVNKNYQIPKIIANFYSVDIRDFSKVDDVEETVLDLIELNKNIVVTNYSPKYKNVLDIFKEYGLPYELENNIEKYLDKEITYENLDMNDINIIYDFFEKKHDNYSYHSLDFIVRYKIKNNGDVYLIDCFNNKTYKKSNLYKIHFVDLIFSKPNYYDIIIEIYNKTQKDLNKSNLWGYHFYNPLVFIYNQNIKEVNDKIIDYKIKLFNLIKNIDAKDYIKLPQELWKMLNECSYIKFNDILPIIKKEDEFLSIY